MGKILKFIIVFSIIVAIICGAGSLISSIGSNNSDKHQLEITNEFTISSSVTNVLKQTYLSTVTGTIKNNTDNTIDDIILKLNVQTTALKHTGTIECPSFSIGPNETKNICFQIDTEENYETILSVTNDKYSIDSYKSEDDLSFINSKNFSIGLLVCLGVIIFCFIVIKVSKKENTNYNANDSSENYKIEETKSQNIYNTYNNTYNSTTNIYIPPEKFVVCPYCGSKINSQNTKCPNCGGNI